MMQQHPIPLGGSTSPHANNVFLTKEGPMGSRWAMGHRPADVMPVQDPYSVLVAVCDVLQRRSYEMFGFGTNARFVVDFTTVPPSLTAVCGTNSVPLVSGASTFPDSNTPSHAGDFFAPPFHVEGRKYVVQLTERSLIIEDLTEWDGAHVNGPAHDVTAEAYVPPPLPPRTSSMSEDIKAPAATPTRKRSRHLTSRPSALESLGPHATAAGLDYVRNSDTDSPLAGEPAPFRQDNKRSCAGMDALLYATLGEAGSGHTMQATPSRTSGSGSTSHHRTVAPAALDAWQSDGESSKQSISSSSSFDAGARQFLSDCVGCKGKDAHSLLDALYQTALTSHSKYTAQVNLVAYHTSGKYVMRKWAMASVRDAIECRSLGRRMNRYYLRLPPAVLARLPPDEDLREFKSKGLACAYFVHEVLGVAPAIVPKVAENSLTVERSYAILKALAALYREEFSVPTRFEDKDGYENEDEDVDVVNA